jgi:transcriptional regulator with XRE-family HTH domain
MDGLTHIQIDHEKLRAARERKGLSQEEVGAQVGVGSGQISHIECGRKLPSAEILARLCLLYEIGINDLTSEAQAA